MSKIIPKIATICACTACAEMTYRAYSPFIEDTCVRKLLRHVCFAMRATSSARLNPPVRFKGHLHVGEAILEIVSKLSLRCSWSFRQSSEMLPSSQHRVARLLGIHSQAQLGQFSHLGVGQHPASCFCNGLQASNLKFIAVPTLSGGEEVCKCTFPAQTLGMKSRHGALCFSSNVTSVTVLTRYICSMSLMHDGVTVDNMWRTPGRTLIRGVQSKLLCAPLTLSSLIQCKPRASKSKANSSNHGTIAATQPCLRTRWSLL